MNNPCETKQSYATDVMRIIAAFGVVVIHCTGTASGCERVFDALFRFSVPLFFIISGYYMLSKEISGKKLLKKIGKLFFLMVMTSAGYYLLDLWSGKVQYTGISGIMGYLFTQPVHLWYLYAAMTLYLFTPVLFVFCSNANKRQFQYALGLTFLLGSVCFLLVRGEMVPELRTILERMKVPYVQGSVCLYLLGAYFYRFPVEHKKLLYIGGVAATCVSVAGSALLWCDYFDFTSFFAPNTMLAGAAFFVWVHAWCKKHPADERWHRAAKLTLGVYLIHPMVLRLLSSVEQLRFFWSRGSIAGMILWPVLVFALSYLAVFVIRILPMKCMAQIGAHRQEKKNFD